MVTYTAGRPDSASALTAAPGSMNTGVNRLARLALYVGTAVCVAGLSKAHAVAHDVLVVGVVALRLVARLRRCCCR